MTITIVVIDDHPLVRDSLVRALNDDGHTVVGACGSPEEARRLVSATRPHVVLVDANLGAGTEGVDLARQLRRADVRIAVVSMHEDERRVRLAMLAGVVGLVSKDEPLEELLTAVRTVAGGGSYTSPRLASSVLALGGGEGGPEPPDIDLLRVRPPRRSVAST